MVVTPASEPERTPVAALAKPVHAVTGESVDVAFVDQGDTGEPLAADAHTHGIRLKGINRSDANRGFVLLPRRRVGERDVAWMARIRRMSRDDERLPENVAGVQVLAGAMLGLKQFSTMMLERI